MSMSGIGRTLALMVLLALLLAVSHGRQAAADEKPDSPGQPAALTDRYGDPLPPGAVMRLGSTRLRQPDQVTSLSFAPDGKTLAVGCDDHTIRLWDVATGKAVGTLQGTGHYNYHVAFSPDGKILASEDKVGGTTVIRLWDVASRQQIDQFVVGHEDWVNALAFSPDGKLLATGAGSEVDGTIRLWDLAKGTEVGRVQGKGQVSGLAFAPDGHTLVSCSRRPTSNVDNFVWLWEVPSCKQLWKVEAPNSVLSVAFSLDGKTIATGASEEPLRLFDAVTGERLKTPDAKGTYVAFSPDGKILALGSHEGGVRLWDWKTGQEVAKLQGHGSSINCLAFAPDGKTMASGGREGTVILWDVASGRRLHPPVGHQYHVLGVAYAPDGKTLATRGGDHTVRIWDAATGKELRRLEAGPSRDYYVTADQFHSLAQCIAYSPDGKLLASQGLDRAVRLWDASTGQLVFRLTGHTRRIICLAFAPDGKMLATGDDEGFIRLWRVLTGEELRCLDFQGKEVPQGKRGGVLSLAFAPDSKTLAVGCDDPMIRLWDADTGAKRGEYKGWGDTLLFSADGRFLLAADRHGPKNQPVIHVLLAGGGDEVRTLSGHQGPYGRIGLALSADGKTLASAGEADRTVRLWEMATGQEIGKLQGHDSGVFAAAFAPDGKAVASASQDGTVLIWDPWMAARAQAVGLAESWSPSTGEQLWADLASRDAVKARQALVVLTVVPDRGVALLRQRLKPARQSRTIPELIADLDSEEFKVREAASRELQALGPEALDGVLEAMRKPPSAEVEKRLKEVLQSIREGTPSLDVLRQGRAIQALEQIASKEARQLLEELATGAPAHSQTRDAQAAVERLRRRQAP
jgi:WD40 repeat protein